MEVLLQVADHAIARVTVRSQERMVVSYAVQCLPNRLLRESRFEAVLGGECLDRTFFFPDVALDLSTSSLLRDDLLCSRSDEWVS